MKPGYQTTGNTLVISDEQPFTLFLRQEEFTFEE
jgi:hypothetical protein